jgi:ribosomal protein S18 acetylase RimI-like enzyme
VIDLEILGVDPAYQGRGLASKLLKWGIARADEEGVEIYLSSSPEGRRMYEKYGFESRHSFSPFPGYEQLNMIRPIQK